VKTTRASKLTGKKVTGKKFFFIEGVIGKKPTRGWGGGRQWGQKAKRYDIGFEKKEHFPRKKKKRRRVMSTKMEIETKREKGYAYAVGRKCPFVKEWEVEKKNK